MANIVEKLSESVKSLGIGASYGDPVTVGGAQIIPVAVTWFGFGGGSEDAGSEDTGTDDAASTKDGADASTGDGSTDHAKGGSGGGGGGASIPVGAYVDTPDGAVFRPNIVALLWVLIPLTWVSGKSLALVIKALKK
ncbi:hypothetical protein [Marisediminicola senii]|uniref:hypothetical protein n=1 Tax=Marisediminicola senii TaxID=2711233 RepID=UPI0013ED7729|nr:hypothetical protein [Marisediminicola senii]